MGLPEWSIQYQSKCDPETKLSLPNFSSRRQLHRAGDEWTLTLTNFSLLSAAGCVPSAIRKGAGGFAKTGTLSIR